MDEFIKFCRSGAVKQAREFIDEGKITDLDYDDGYFSLVAAQNNQLGVLMLLADKGANLHIDNESALWTAAHDGYLSCVKFLVEEQNADIGQIKDTTAYTNFPHVARYFESVELDEKKDKTAEEWIIIGDTHRTLGEDRKALNYYTAAVESDPKCARAHLNIGKVKFSDNLKEEALKSVEQAIEAQPDLSEAYFIRSLLLFEIGKEELALKSLYSAPEIQSENFTTKEERANAIKAWLNKGNVLSYYLQQKTKQ